MSKIKNDLFLNADLTTDNGDSDNKAEYTILPQQESLYENDPGEKVVYDATLSIGPPPNKVINADHTLISFVSSSVIFHVSTHSNFKSAISALFPRKCSILNSSFIFAIRAPSTIPVLIIGHLKATAKWAICQSHVSPERCDITVV